MLSSHKLVTYVCTAGATGALLMLLSPTSIQAQGKATVSPVPRVAAVQAGQPFEVDVVVEATVPIRTVQAGLRFDPALVEVLSVEEGPFLKQFAASQGGETAVLPAQPRIDNTAGTVEVYSVTVMGMKVVGGATGKGVLWTYHMQAKSGMEGTSPLTLESVIVGDENADPIAEADVVVNSGQVAVGAAGAAGAPVVPTAVATSPAMPTGVSPAPVPVAPPGEGRSLPTELIVAVVGGLIVLVIVAALVLRK